MDRAERLIRQAKPANSPLGKRAEADLVEILSGNAGDPASPVQVPHRPSPWVWAAVAAVVIVLMITGTYISHPGKAVAATPPMPIIATGRQSAVMQLEQLRARAVAQPDRSIARKIVTQWWALASDVDSTGTITASTVDPTRRIATLGNHGITSYTDYAVQPYDVFGRAVNDPNAPAPGTRLDTVAVDPDQQVFPDPPPTTPEAFGSYFTDHLPLNSPSPTSNAFTGIRTLMGERILTPAQQAAFLGYLASLPDIRLLGTTTDRLGRGALVFAAPTQKDNQTILMISPDAASITATEVIYRGAGRADIPTPAVVEYVAWETP